MGKKGKRSGKTGGGGGSKAAAKPKQGPGKARRERAAALREIDARLDALIAKLDVELRDVELFGPPEEREECPICFVPMPLEPKQKVHVRCCGKTACMACALASNATGLRTCPFCRAQIHDEEHDQQLRNRVELGDVFAMEILAESYEIGGNGVQKDDVAGMRLWLQAAELGHLPGLCALASRHLRNEFEGRTTLEQAMKLAEAAAKKGSVEGHHFLGILGLDIDKDMTQERALKVEKAMKHLEHAAIAGNAPSFKMLREIRDEGGESLDVLLKHDTFEEMEAKHKEALALEWSEEREEVNKKRELERELCEIVAQLEAG